MRSSFASLTMLTLAALTGCTQGTPGGPGTTDRTSQKPTYGQADDTFNLSVPMMSSYIQQGKQTEATIGIQRAKNFDEDVALQFADIPTGVTVQPTSPVIKRGDTDARLTFNAESDAPLGDFQVKVTGHPTNGGDAQIEFKLTVAARDTFKLNVPRSASLKQGETKTVSIGIKRDKSFDQDVALTFGDMPTGVTLVPEAPVIKHGDAEAQVVLSGADDAALGNFAIKVTGHPTEGADAANELQLTVAQK